MNRLIGLILPILAASTLVAQEGLQLQQTEPALEGLQYQLIADDVTLIEEQSLVFSPANPAIRFLRDPEGEPSDGLRFYAFILKPKEKLDLSMTSESSNRVAMLFMEKHVPDKMKAEYRRIQRRPAQLRASRLDITNLMDTPYKVFLMVYGRRNHWYKIKVTRKL